MCKYFHLKASCGCSICNYATGVLFLLRFEASLSAFLSTRSFLMKRRKKEKEKLKGKTGKKERKRQKQVCSWHAFWIPLPSMWFLSMTSLTPPAKQTKWQCSLLYFSYFQTLIFSKTDHRSNENSSKYIFIPFLSIGTGKAQWKGKEDKADRRRGGKTTPGNGQAWGSSIPQGSREQRTMLETGWGVISGAPTTLEVKG